MRFLILITILLAIDGYAFLAVRTIIADWPLAVKYAFYGFYWLVPIVAILFIATPLGREIEEWNKHAYLYLRTFLFIAYISKLLILPILLIDDAWRLGSMVYHKFSSPMAVDAGRSKFLSQAGVFLGAVPFVTLMYGLVRNPYRYKVFTEKIALRNLPTALKGLRIVQISDIHSGSLTFKEPVKEAIKLINDLKPDIIFFTGDLVNTRADEMDRFIDVFDKISAPHGIYSVMGNHDYGDYHRWDTPEDKEQNLLKLQDTHRKLGWDLLNNENRIIQINNEPVAVIGVENYSAHPRFPKYGDLEKAYQGTDTANLKLLLSHDPSHWLDQVAEKYEDIAITFSGHTHGMQFGIEIPGWIKWSPIQYVYKQWAGLYQQKDQYLYVNRGLGFHGYPGRVGILPEITCIELEKA